MHHTTLSHHIIAWHDGGSPHQAGQPAVLLIHGAGGDHSLWAGQSRYLSHHGINLIALDLPGHGQSHRKNHRQSAPTDALKTIDSYVDVIDEFLRALDIKKAVVVGHSMGGLITLALAEKHPSAIAGLGLVGVGGAMPVNEALLQAAQEKPEQAARMIAQWGMAERGERGGAPQIGYWLSEGVVRLMADQAPGVLHDDLKACDLFGKRPLEIASNLPHLPLHILLSQNDRMTPARSGNQLLAACEDGHSAAKKVMIEKAGHMMMVENPVAVRRALDLLVRESYAT